MMIQEGPLGGINDEWNGNNIWMCSETKLVLLDNWVSKFQTGHEGFHTNCYIKLKQPTTALMDHGLLVGLSHRHFLSLRKALKFVCLYQRCHTQIKLFLPSLQKSSHQNASNHWINDTINYTRPSSWLIIPIYTYKNK